MILSNITLSFVVIATIAIANIQTASGGLTVDWEFSKFMRRFKKSSDKLSLDKEVEGILTWSAIDKYKAKIPNPWLDFLQLKEENCATEKIESRLNNLSAYPKVKFSSVNDYLTFFFKLQVNLCIRGQEIDQQQPPYANKQEWLNWYESALRHGQEVADNQIGVLVSKIASQLRPLQLAQLEILRNSVVQAQGNGRTTNELVDIQSGFAKGVALYAVSRVDEEWVKKLAYYNRIFADHYNEYGSKQHDLARSDCGRVERGLESATDKLMQQTCANVVDYLRDAIQIHESSNANSAQSYGEITNKLLDYGRICKHHKENAISNTYYVQEALKRVIIPY